mmetsp:Transcript_52333/g.131448  ORF Transcript_52333/g.131448 Transcript_52333/m.131448 type:complete len:225 (-) Transcript_52333:632-1306(-)
MLFHLIQRQLFFLCSLAGENCACEHRREDVTRGLKRHLSNAVFWEFLQNLRTLNGLLITHHLSTSIEDTRATIFTQNNTLLCFQRQVLGKNTFMEEGHRLLTLQGEETGTYTLGSFGRWNEALNSLEDRITKNRRRERAHHKQLLCGVIDQHKRCLGNRGFLIYTRRELLHNIDHKGALIFGRIMLRNRLDDTTQQLRVDCVVRVGTNRHCRAGIGTELTIVHE